MAFLYKRPQLVALFVALGYAYTPEEITAALNHTEQAVGLAEDLCKKLHHETKNASLLSALISGIEAQQEAAAQGVVDGYKSLMSLLKQRLNTSEEDAAANLTEESLAALLSVSHDLRAAESTERRSLKAAVKNVTKAAVMPRLHRADYAAHAAYESIHPLYSMGDKTEDKADRFNDRVNDAKSCSRHALHIILKHAEAKGAHIVKKIATPERHEAKTEAAEVHKLQKEEKKKEKKEKKEEKKEEKEKKTEETTKEKAQALYLAAPAKRLGMLSATFLLASASGSAVTFAAMSAFCRHRARDLANPLLQEA